MKNKFLGIILAAMMVCGLVGCGNMDLLDTQYTFDYAYIKLQNGEVIEGKVQSWTDYEDGDQLQIKINGTTYLVHSENATLIAK